MSEVININADRFDEVVLKSAVPVLVDFWAPWCGPCRMMTPVLDELAKGMGEKAHIVKIDVENPENNMLANQFSIRSIPAMKIFKGGKVVEEYVGMRSRGDLESGLQKHLQK